MIFNEKNQFSEISEISEISKISSVFRKFSSFFSTFFSKQKNRSRKNIFIFGVGNFSWIFLVGKISLLEFLWGFQGAPSTANAFSSPVKIFCVFRKGVFPPSRRCGYSWRAMSYESGSMVWPLRSKISSHFTKNQKIIFDQKFLLANWHGYLKRLKTSSNSKNWRSYPKKGAGW